MPIPPFTRAKAPKAPKADKTPAAHRHVENLDYARTMGDYHSAYQGKRKELTLGAWTRKEEAPKWLRKSITVGVNEHGFFTANGSLIRRSIIERNYNLGGTSAIDRD